jgi:hypothetical protein
MKFFFEKKRITRLLSASKLREGRLTPPTWQETTLPVPYDPKGRRLHLHGIPLELKR